METINNRVYEDIPLGLQIRGTINKERIFRIRRGNGFYGSKLGAKYQDQYQYTIPSSINNTQSQLARSLLAQAMNIWSNQMNDEEKAPYNRKAKKIGGLFGFNLFVKKFIKEHI